MGSWVGGVAAHLQGVLHPVTGKPGTAGYGDGLLSRPSGLCMVNGRLLVVDAGNHKIRSFDKKDNKLGEPRENPPVSSLAIASFTVFPYWCVYVYCVVRRGQRGKVWCTCGHLRGRF